MPRIPDKLRLAISRKTNTEIWDLKGLMQAVKEELDMRERCTSITQSTKKRKDSRDFKKGIKFTQGSKIIVLCYMILC